MCVGLGVWEGGYFLHRKPSANSFHPLLSLSAQLAVEGGAIFNS